jgi:hypothetical protein
LGYRWCFVNDVELARMRLELRLGNELGPVSLGTSKIRCRGQVAWPLDVRYRSGGVILRLNGVLWLLHDYVPDLCHGIAGVGRRQNVELPNRSDAEGWYRSGN